MLCAIVFPISWWKWWQHIFYKQNNLTFDSSFNCFRKHAQYIYRPKIRNANFLPVSLLIGDTAAILAAYGNIPLDRLSLIVFVRDPYKILTSRFTRFGCIFSKPAVFLISVCFSRVATWDCAIEWNVKEFVIVFFQISAWFL